MDTLSCIKARHSTRDFTSKKIKRRDLLKILNAGNLAPSAGNLNSWVFVVIDDDELLPKIADATLFPEIFSNVRTAIIVCSKTSRVTAEYPERGKLYAAHNTGAAIQNMLLAAAELGIASLWLGGLNEDKIRLILEIPDDIDVHAIIPLGYERAPHKRPSKKPTSQITFFNAWAEKTDGRGVFPLVKHVDKIKKKLRRKKK